MSPYTTQKRRLFTGYDTFLKQWEFDWFAHLTFPASQKYGDDIINRMRLTWTRQLCTQEHLQVAYFYVLVRKNFHPHLHLLMIGSGKTKDGNFKILCDVDENLWATMWPHRAKIGFIRVQEKARRYFIENILKGNPAHIDFSFYNTKLLKDLKVDDFDSQLNALF